MKRYQAILIPAIFFISFAFMSNDDYYESLKTEEYANNVIKEYQLRVAEDKRQYNRLAKEGYRLTGFNSEMKWSHLEPA